ncbi:DNA (cytosine-5-)-methyltransferase [Hydrocoleum sp. CS-953]|uniref:DNA cytosine methyltransferase n=1 Tax=Hydrocoleum sp. CS-953 TaxID=1671698 RepID=UPI001FEFEA51
MGIRDRVRGTLFEGILEIIQAKKPKYFLLENVKRIIGMEKGHHFRIILNALASLDYFIEWRIINPINFGIPENRDRIFIFGTCIESTQNTPALEKFSVFLTDNDIESLPGNENSEIQKYMQPIMNFSSKNYNWGIAYQNQMYSQPSPLMVDIKPRKKLKDILQDESEINPQFDFTSDTQERIKKSKTVNRYCNGVEILYNQGGRARLGYTIFGINGVTSTLTASTSRHYERYQVGNKFRRLTNIEYARLMGFPENWCRIAKIYHQYALYGNSVVPDCVEWICQRIGKQNFKFKHQPWQQLTLF